MLPAYSTPAKVLKLWKKGLLGRAEFLFRLLQTINDQNLTDFLLLVPPDILEDVKEKVQEAPTTSVGWSEMFVIQSWCGPWNEEIAERGRQEDEESIRHYRKGVETLRTYFSNKD